KDAYAFIGEFFEHGAIELGSSVRSLRPALGIIGVGGKTETDAGGVTFAAAGIELHQARGTSKQEDEDTGGERVERTKMADLAKSGETPNGVDDVVGSFSLRLVNDERAVERSGLW